MTPLALTIVYGGIPTTRQMVVATFLFLLGYSIPLIIAAVALHRTPRRQRICTDLFLAIVATVLAVGTPGGVLLEGTAMLFAVIGIAASVDLFHIGPIWGCIGMPTLLLSGLTLYATTGTAFVHALRSSYRY